MDRISVFLKKFFLFYLYFLIFSFKSYSIEVSKYGEAVHDYKQTVDLLKGKDDKISTEDIDEIKSKVPKESIAIYLLVQNSLELNEEDFYKLIQFYYKDLFKIKNIRNFYIDSIISKKDNLAEIDILYINYILTLKDFNSNFKIFNKIKNKKINDIFLDQLTTRILKAEGLKNIGYFDFIIENKNYLKNKDIIFLVNKIFYENKNSNQTLLLIKKIKNIIKNKEIQSWIEESEKFFKDTKGGKIINANIIKKYAGISEYVDLSILESSNASKDIKYEILKKRKDISLFPDKWYKIFLILTREMIFRDEDDRYFHDDLHLYEEKIDLQSQFEIINGEILEILENIQELSFDNQINQLWLCAYLLFKLKRYNEASVYFEKLKETTTSKRELTKALFWLSECYLKLGDIDKQRQYLQIAASYPLFFYGQFAIEKMDIDLKEFIKQKFKENKKIGKEKFEEIFDDVLFSVYFLMKFDDEDFSKDILRITLKSDNVSDEIKLKILAFLKHYDKNHHSAAVKGNEPFVVSSDFYELKTVTKNPFLHALIKKESNFGKNSKSHKGARGLMQIMPQTAMLIAKQLNVKYDVFRLLSDNDYNLAIGTAYLEFIIKKYDGHKMISLAAYNAGPGRVDRWLLKKGDPRLAKEISEIILWTERIPIKETRDYVKKIMESEIIYEILYDEV